MDVSATIALLKVVTAMLVVLQGSHASSTTLQQAVNAAQNSVQVAAQAGAGIPFAVTKNDGIWPNMKDLGNAAYRNANGEWVRLGSGVSLVEQYTSFGDLNNDGSDDAAIVVNKPGASGSPNYFLVAMLNQGGVMFDIAELPLGNSVNIASHQIASGVITIDSNRYELFGTALSAI